MKKIGDFLFVEQCFADIEETKPAVVNVNFIDNIVCTNTDKFGEVVVIETDNSKSSVETQNNSLKSSVH